MNNNGGVDMTEEYLKQQKTMYQQKLDYLQSLSFDNLAADFKSIVDLIGEMENYIKEKEHGKD